MTTVDHIDLDRALASVLDAVPTTGALARMDARVSAAIAASDARWFPRPTLPRLRRSRGVVLVAVAALVTMAAGGATLIDRVFRNSTPAWELAWSRAKPLGLSQTVRGVTVGVDSAYMDDSRVVIGLTMEGYAYAYPQLRVDGRRASGGAVYQVPDESGSAAVLNFLTPSDIGARAELELVVPFLCVPGAPVATTPDPEPSLEGDPPADPPATDACQSGPGADPRTIRGPWRFAFALTNAGGSRWSGSVTDVAAGVTITLDRLSVSPTSVEATMHWSGDPLRRSGDDVWSASGWLEHDGHRIGVGTGSTWGDRGEIGGQPGSDDPQGEWTLHIDELTSDPGYPPRHFRIEGPWVFKVTMPR